MDDVIRYREQALTEIIYLVQDSAPRAASIIYTPVVSRVVDKFIGFCAVVFYWDTLLSSGLPTALGGLDVVMESQTGQQHTFRLTNVSAREAAGRHAVPFPPLPLPPRACLNAVNDACSGSMNLCI